MPPKKGSARAYSPSPTKNQLVRRSQRSQTRASDLGVQPYNEYTGEPPKSGGFPLFHLTSLLCVFLLVQYVTFEVYAVSDLKPANQRAVIAHSVHVIENWVKYHATENAEWVSSIEKYEDRLGNEVEVYHTDILKKSDACLDFLSPQDIPITADMTMHWNYQFCHPHALPKTRRESSRNFNIIVHNPCSVVVADVGKRLQKLKDKIVKEPMMRLCPHMITTNDSFREGFRSRVAKAYDAVFLEVKTGTHDVHDERMMPYYFCLLWAMALMLLVLTWVITASKRGGGWVRFFIGFWIPVVCCVVLFVEMVLKSSPLLKDLLTGFINTQVMENITGILTQVLSMKVVKDAMDWRFRHDDCQNTLNAYTANYMFWMFICIGLCFGAVWTVVHRFCRSPPRMVYVCMMSFQVSLVVLALFDVCLRGWYLAFGLCVVAVVFLDSYEAPARMMDHMLPYMVTNMQTGERLLLSEEFFREAVRREIERMD